MPADASRSTHATSWRCSQHLAPGGELALDFADEITAGACVTRPKEETAVSDLPLVIELTILALAIFLGFEVISKVPTMLHTPLMSGTNFIHGIVIVGAILVLGYADDTFTRSSASSRSCSRPRTSSAAGSSPTGCSRCSSAARAARGGEAEAVISDTNVIGLLYLATIICFILALRFLSSPKHARKGNWVGGAGMLIAIATTLAARRDRQLGADRGRRGDRLVVGVVGARKVKMTAMPQMVALFNGVGGGAAALCRLAEFHRAASDPGTKEAVSIVLSALIGVDLVRGLARRLRQAPGADPRPADRLPGAERRQHALVLAPSAAFGIAQSRASSTSGCSSC